MGTATTAVQQSQQLGTVLRKRRREQNLSLKEVENATSIRMNYLKSIEEGQIASELSTVYAQGFVRQYANFLGLDGDTLVHEHPELFTAGRKQEFAYGIGTLEVRGHPGAGVKWFPNGVWLAAFGAVALFAWLFARLLGVL